MVSYRHSVADHTSICAPNYTGFVQLSAAHHTDLSKPHCWDFVRSTFWICVGGSFGFVLVAGAEGDLYRATLCLRSEFYLNAISIWLHPDSDRSPLYLHCALSGVLIRFWSQRHFHIAAANSTVLVRATSDLNAISKPIITVDTRCLPTSLFFKYSASPLGKSPVWLFLCSLLLEVLLCTL